MKTQHEPLAASFLLLRRWAAEHSELLFGSATFQMPQNAALFICFVAVVNAFAVSLIVQQSFSKFRMVRFLFVTGLFFLLQHTKHEMKPIHIYGRAQGTTYHITYYAADSVVTKHTLDSTFARLDQSLSIYQPESLINAFNKSTAGSTADEHLKKVVTKALEVYKKTGGAFDITVLPLTEAWGFGAQKKQAPPDTATIQSLLPCIGSDKLQLHKNKIRKTNPCVRIDVNGIAQGYTVDVLAGLLEKKGIKNYLVEVGGEIRVRGCKQPECTPFTIGIEAPAAAAWDPAPMQRLLQIPYGGLTTSGHYRNFYQSGSKRVTHLFDPKTGFPVQNELISVTVWAPDAITADAYDNALMVLGLEKSFSLLAKRKNLEAYFIYQKQDGTVADTATKGFYKFIIRSDKQ